MQESSPYEGNKVKWSSQAQAIKVLYKEEKAQLKNPTEDLNDKRTVLHGKIPFLRSFLFLFVLYEFGEQSGIYLLDSTPLFQLVLNLDLNEFDYWVGEIDLTSGQPLQTKKLEHYQDLFQPTSIDVNICNRHIKQDTAIDKLQLELQAATRTSTAFVPWSIRSIFVRTPNVLSPESLIIS